MRIILIILFSCVYIFFIVSVSTLLPDELKGVFLIALGFIGGYLFVPSLWEWLSR